MKIGKGLAGCAGNLSRDADPPLRVDRHAFLLTPGGRRQDEISKMSRLGVVLHVLHDEKVEPLEHIARHALVDPGMSGVRGNDPQPANFAAQDSLEDAVVRPTGLAWDRRLVD